MIHYVILCDSAVDRMGYDETHVIAVTHTLEEAKKILIEKSLEDKKHAFEHGWVIHVDNDEEFDAGEDGYYAAEHTHFYIETVNDEPEIVRDLSEESVNRDIEDCPLGGDISDDCDGCVYSEDYHFIDGECKEREVK